MTTLKDDLSLEAEIAHLHAIMRGLASEDETEQHAAAAFTADLARVMSVLIRAVEVEHDLRHADASASEGELAAVIARSLDALTREEAARRVNANRNMPQTKEVSHATTDRAT